MLFLKYFNYLENNNNCDFNSNGEKLFIKNLFAYFKQNNQKKVNIFDIGSNKGDYAEILYKTSKENDVNVRIYCFEPDSYAFAKLFSRFKSNNNFKLYNFA
ncbi:unnamed protein product, partial [marine sediment metagenome]